MPKFRFLRLAVGAAAMLVAFGAHAQSAADAYPTKPIRLLVGYGPGGVADVTARIVASGLERKLGKPVIVENAPSAGGITASINLTHAAPDGYTLIHLNSQHAISPGLFKSLPYDPVTQFAAIAPFASFDIVMLVDKDSPMKTVQDAIDLAKKDPSHFNIGSVAVGSTQNLSAELFRAMTGVKVPAVPFKTTGEVINAVRGKSVQVMFETVPGVIGNIRSGDLRILGVASEKPSPMFPDRPTINATVPGYVAVAWNGLGAPIGTPRPIIDKLNGAIRDIMADPDIRKKLLAVGAVPLPVGTPEQFHDFLVSEIAKWGKVINDAKIEKQ
jgi:tripartite-type tricarboxylate transporter receptor subunit TctC